MLRKSHFYKTVLSLDKTITHKLWTGKNDFAQFYIKVTIVGGGGDGKDPEIVPISLQPKTLKRPHKSHKTLFLKFKEKSPPLTPRGLPFCLFFKCPRGNYRIH